MSLSFVETRNFAFLVWCMIGVNAAVLIGIINGLPWHFFDYCILIFFALELTARVSYLGWYEYKADGWNLFDGFTVIIGVCVVGVELLPGDTHLPPFLAGLRSLRIARLMGISVFKPWVEAYLHTLKDMLILGGLIVLAILILTIFSGLSFGGNVPGFENFWYTLATMSHMVTIEPWGDMVPLMWAEDPISAVAIMGFLIIVVILGGLNLLMAAAVRASEKVFKKQDLSRYSTEELQEEIDKRNTA